MSAAAVEITLVTLEGVRLDEVVDEYTTLLSSADANDEALDRLAPTPYPDDEHASRDFAEATRDDLLERRLADADVVRRALAPFQSFRASMTDDDMLRAHTLEVPRGEVDAWLRTLNAIRLVLATRLGIIDDDDHDPEDPRFGIYDWIGYRLELLIDAEMGD
ncbi:DUF2017 family protein [Microbacterium galbinum]|uniref:DUF2017 domain-containing protein n=1 Tax=Microbacterium galbinum TaxID=2851646 RepID=A0ABY4IUI0_9MICO|nr:DUF2017 family protein [Microbacterium galbinum]UPL15531.1 DUF2017 domain-containing protein [Microbacterium galbinum]